MGPWVGRRQSAQTAPQSTLSPRDARSVRARKASVPGQGRATLPYGSPRTQRIASGRTNRSAVGWNWSTPLQTRAVKVVYLVTMRPSTSAVASLPFVAITMALACGGGETATPSRTPVDAHPASPSGGQPTPAEVAEAQKPCGAADHVHAHDLNSGEASSTFAPCSANGPRDYSAIVRIQTIDEGVHIFIDATDDEVTLLGPDVKDRDVVMVYPKGKGSQGVEVGLVKTKTGYSGDKIVFWNDLGTLTDEGTRIDMAIFDHDKSAKTTEEMHVALAVSTGKSCERARDDNPQTLDMRHKQATPDLTREQLGAPMRTSSFFANCGLSDNEKADICIAVKLGKALGVSVTVAPQDNRVAACIDRSARRLSFPVSDNLDVVRQTF